MGRIDTQRGQAMAEYHVLIPIGILLAGFMLPLIAFAGRSMYCDAVRVFNPDACAAELVESDGAPDAEEDVCVVYVMMEGGSQCDASDDCTLIDVSINNGTWTTDPFGDPLESFVIKAGQDYFIYESGETEDGCYYVDFAEDGYSVSWTKIGDGPSCKDVSHTEMWYVSLCVE